MPAIYKDGVLSYVPEVSLPTTMMPPGLSPLQQKLWEDEQRRKAEYAAAEQEATAAGGADTRPGLATDSGMLLRDTGRVLANAAVGLVTDVGDVAAGIVDTAAQTGNLALGRGFQLEDWFDDSDNPWTQWRRTTFRTESKAGEAVSNLLRIGSFFIPATGGFFKAAAKLPLNVVGKADDVSRVIGRLKTIAVGQDEITAAARTTERLTRLKGAFEAGTAAEKATSRALRNDWLRLTYEDVGKSIAKAPELEGVASWMDSVRRSTAALTQLSRGSFRANVKTVGQALAWDAFAAFNVYGEGDDEFDQTLGDLANDFNIPALNQLASVTATDPLDYAITRKAKQMLEGVATGAAFNVALDMIRVNRFAQQFKAATPEQRKGILQAFDLESYAIGEQLGRLLPEGEIAGALPYSRPGAGEPPMLPASTAEGSRGRALDELFAQVQAQRQEADFPRDWVADQARQQLTRMQAGTPRLPGGPEDLNSPVQNRLAQMDGLASQLDIDQDPLYQEWLFQRAPQEGIADAFLPPGGEASPALRQFTEQGPPPQPAAPPTPDDLAQYRAWLEEKARMPEAELDPRVQQSLRRLDGVGELAPVPQQEPGGLALGGPIEQVRVQELRPPEAVVTPQTIRNAWAEQSLSVWREAQALTLEEGPDGVMRAMKEQVELLMPRTRVDALEYLRQSRPVANKYGVVNAADSVWSNYIVERALSEGWASIDPGTMSLRFNRQAAASADRGELADRQLAALDEAAQPDPLQMFRERFAGQVEGIDQQAQEIGAGLDQMAEGMGRQVPRDAAAADTGRYQAWLKSREGLSGPPMDPGAQDALGRMEARDAYDQWEGDRAGARSAYDQWEGQQADQAGVRSAYDQWEADQGAQTRAFEAAADADGFAAAEELRLSEGSLAAMRGELSDEQVVLEMLGTTLDEIEAPTVQQAAAGRGWEVYDRNGELLGTARTRTAAQKIADRQLRLDREALLARARQMEADDADEALDMTIGEPVYDSALMGSVKLTDAQITAVQGLLPRLDQLLDEAWLQRRGPSAFYNVNDLGPQKRTFELSQDEMRALGEAIQREISGDGVAGQRKRVLRTLADKLDSEMKLMEPQARAQRFVDELVSSTEHYNQHGEFCDFF